jgi:ribosomal protein L11 methyltransferase
MWRVEVRCALGDEDIALAGFVGYDIAAADTGDGYACAWFTSEPEAQQCAAALAGVVEPVANENWNQSWQAEWKACAVGNRFWLAPPWDDAPTPEGRLRLNLHPGMLFGNGDHPTTQLCLAALEHHVTPDCTVLDVGCGSGLLLEAASLLGATRAIGCDLDFEAAQAAPCAFQGSAGAIATSTVDVLVANIQLAVLIELLPEFDRVLNARGTMILSGILEEQIAEFPRDRSCRWTVKGGWACVVLAAPPP